MDASFGNGSFSVTSYWSSRLSSLFGIVFNNSELLGKQNSYTTLTLGGKYKLLENKLQLTAVFSPSFGDFKRQTFELSADYNVLANLNLLFQMRLFRVPDASTNSIIGVTTILTF